MYKRTMRPANRFTPQGRLARLPRSTVKTPESDENLLQQQCCNLLRWQYKGIYFRSDGAGINKNRFEAGMQKVLNSHRGITDIEIIEPRHGFASLYIELKIEGTKLKRTKDATRILKGDYKIRKAGDWWDLHIEEQALWMEAMRKRGRKAEFAVGFDEYAKLVLNYLGAPNNRFEGF